MILHSQTKVISCSKETYLKSPVCYLYLQYGIYSGHSSSLTLYLICLAFLDTSIHRVCGDVLFRCLGTFILLPQVRFWEWGLKDMENHFTNKNHFMPKLFLLFTIPTSTGSWHRHTDYPQSHIKLSLTCKEYNAQSFNFHLTHVMYSKTVIIRTDFTDFRFYGQCLMALPHHINCNCKSHCSVIF